MFREDLYHRLNVIRLRLPSLRERREDIRLAGKTLPREEARASWASRENACRVKWMDYLAAQDFPGNVRQLENLCHWLTVMAPTQSIEIADLPAEMKQGGAKVAESDWVGALEREVERAFASGETAVLDRFSQAFEKALIGKALARTGGRRIEAANLLGMGRNTITRKIAELRIWKPRAVRTKAVEAAARIGVV